MKRHFRRWRARGARLSRRRRTLLIATVILALAWAAALMLRGPQIDPDHFVADAGPSEPPCPTLLRLGDQDVRCTIETIEQAPEFLEVALLTPAFSPKCRAILSDPRGNLIALKLNTESTGVSGTIGPISRSATAYTLRFVALDERISAADACGLWADVSAHINRPLPKVDAGRAEAGK